jgi:transcriptional regulator with GAF, ATPase, and Fis domain
MLLIGDPAPVIGASPVVGASDQSRTLQQAERELIAATLERLGGRVAGPGAAAEALGINASTLRSRMRRLGLQRQRRRAADYEARSTMPNR